MKVVAFTSTFVAASSVTPTQKVIQLLQDMAAKGRSEKEAEEVKFSKFSQWCSNTEQSKSAAIAKEKDTIAELSAEIDKLTADVSTLTREIEHLDSEVEQHKTDIKAATEVRGHEKVDFDATFQDYSESNDAIQGALDVLAAQAHAAQDKLDASLLQLTLASAKIMPEHAKKMIMSMLQQSTHEPEGIHAQAPEAHYVQHAGGIVDMLKELKAKFRSDLNELEKKELNAKYEFEQMVQTLNDEIEADTKRRNRKAKSKAAKEQRIAEAEGEQKEEEADLAADSKYLADLQAECAAKTTDFDARQKLRSDEIDAIGKAIDILSGDAVSGSADRHLPSLVQGTSFLQLRSAAKIPAQDKVVAYLQEAAERTGSRLLQTVADSAGADPFTKVKKMIKDMIVKLKEEANEEAEHSAWCSTELTTNKQTRNEKTAEIEELNSKIDGLTASNAKLAMEIQELESAVSELEAARAKATEDRTAEKAKNKATIKDAQEAQEAVKNALAVLKEFYEKAKDATALVQGAPEDAPETFSEPYKGMQGESGGVLGMLEVIQSDFARLEADTTASEESSAEEYKTFSSDSKTDIAVKNADIKGKSDKVSRQDEALSQTREELSSTEKELDAAMDYYEKLKPSCVSSGTNYDDRVKQREDEVQSLKEALKILNGDDIPMPIESGRADYATGASHQGE
mmetsp:Transcript_32446/g.77938  ORF Transcript_32446/g.77938 Transcript_32446/m.77938 type:complete len:683 (+) Transcript_32446:61-2109(+)